ncbi:uncharacterized protein LOC131885907 isoform X3 [Tigriopus californicus]|uniref:uncharacterized protein LOC131885907 isoform X3 n=1 Tax=Tigriopus californicus TaxID=6832 RepID=UPI0027D9DEBF|nr:uncharacterized protein LOC131885907 isoform X3 [Tigriopus californicus]
MIRIGSILCSISLVVYTLNYLRSWYRGRQVELDLDRRKAALTCNPQGDPKTQALEEKRRQLSLRICARCGQGFSLLFNRRLECHTCGLGVCRKCSKWRQDEEAWECEACEGQRDFKEQSCPWFYGHLEKKLNRFESAKVIKSVGYQNRKMDSSTSTVRDHIEKVVESLIGDDLDSVNIIHLSEHPSYKRLFEDYHSSLSDSLSLLTQAIQMVIEKLPTSPEDPTPTTAHIKLKFWIERLIMDVDENELIWENESDFLIRDLPNDKEMYYSQSYEDLLSTAIINKVVLNSKKRPGSNRPDQDSNGVLGPEGNNNNDNDSMEPGAQSSLTSSQSDPSAQIRHRHTGPETTDSSTVTSSTTSSASGNHSEGCSERSQSAASSLSSPSDEEIPSASSSITSEAFSPMEESRENSLSPMLGNAPQFLIEEEIEETTAYQSEDDTTSKVVKTTIAQTSTISKYPSMHSIDCVLADIVEFERDVPVCFPEYGLDLVERKEFNEVDKEEIPENLSILALSALTWEDNWLFCQKRLKVRNSFRVNRSALFYNEPVAMLVPNPNDDQIVRAMIGNREIDEVSELSERQSVASLEYSDSSCSDQDEREQQLEEQQEHEEEEEEVLTSEYPSWDGQKDLEHTEYAVFPNQRQPKPNPEEFLYNRPAPTGDVGFLEVPRNVKVVSGRAARLKAVVSGTKPMDVLWFRGCKLIESSPNVEIRRTSGDCHEMILYHTDALTEGHYSCAVVNQSGEQWHDFNLSVQPSHEEMAKPQILEHPDDMVIEEGHSVRFGCVVTGYPEPRVTFLRDGKVLRANENVCIELLPNGTHRLEIKRCQARHCAQFAVRAENKLGVTEKTWNIEVVLDDDADYGRESMWRGMESQDLDTHENVTPNQSQNTLNDISSCATSEVDDMHSAASTLALSASSPNNNIHHQYLTCLAEAKNTNLVNEAKNELLAQDLGYGESDLETATTSASELEFIDLDRPPARPGTIADREHRKWTENAISLLNNPYSKENIERRLTRGSRDSLHLSSPTDFVRSVNSSHNDLMMTLNAPRKIDCGLRSINSARYRRDYYINGDMDEIPRFKKLSSSSDTKELPSPPPFRTVTSTSHPKDTKQEVKRKGHSDPGPIEKHVEPPPSIKSLEDSSPSDKDGNRSKVEEEIARFQKQIEINRSERTRVKTWELRKSNSHRLGSMDSLLSMDSDYSSGRSAPPLPPKGKYVSNDSLVPPHLPPKTKIHHNHHQGLKKKQVSISTSEVFIHSDSCERSDSDDLTSSTVSSVKSMTTPDREFLHDSESLGGSNDSLATLPSVKELATKFQPKPTPSKVEQQPRTGDISKKNKPRALMKLSSQTSKQENGSTSCSPIDSIDQARHPKLDNPWPNSSTNRTSTPSPNKDFESLSEFSSDESQEDPDDPSTLDISSSLSDSAESLHSPDSLELSSQDDLESLNQEEAEVEELTIHGQVVLEEYLDFEPQIIGADEEEDDEDDDEDDEDDDLFEDIDLNSPGEPPVNEDGIVDDWPYSSDDEDTFRLSMDGFSQGRFTGSSLASIPEEPTEPLTPEEHHFIPLDRCQPNPNHFVWSDLEISSKRRPSELWKRHSLDRETDPDQKGPTHLHQKYASESNIEDALVMMEPGLRKISKETHFTSDESSPSGSGHDYEEQFNHIYSTIDEDPLDENIYEECFGQNSMEESGFYSNIGVSGPESCSNQSGHVTLIQIDPYGPNPCQKASSVTVNGRQIYCNANNYPDAQERSRQNSGPLIQLSQRVQTVIPIRKPQHGQQPHNLTADPTNHNTTTIHSLTARSVPQKFREGLKKGMPFMPDRNIKASVESRAPVLNTDEGTVTTNTTTTTTTTPTSQATLLPVHTKQTTARNPAHSTQLNIVYDSENKNLVPYPDGDFIRSPSPEHSGIPAVPVTMPMRSKDEEYTSDESYGSLPPSRKHPPMRKKSKNGISNNNK